MVLARTDAPEPAVAETAGRRMRGQLAGAAAGCGGNDP
jgi:hypothetical protein